MNMLRTGAPRKAWGDLGQGRKRIETQGIMDEIKKTADARNVEPVKLIGTILHR